MVRLLLILVLISGMAAPASANGLDFARQAQQAESRREFEQAAMLYTKAIESGDLQQNQLIDAIRYRGNASFFLGRFDAAAEDYLHSLKLGPDDLYTSLWLFMAREYAGQDGLPELTRVAERLDLFYWPGPLANLFLGRTDVRATLEAARDPFLDLQGQNEQACEAYYYAGQYALLNGDRETAIRLFRESVKTGVTNFIEYDAARLALERLGG